MASILGASQPHAASGRASLAATADAIRAGLAAGLGAGLGDQYALRAIIQASDDFTALAEADARQAFLAEPPSTGDGRYDALLAALAVHLCIRAGLPTTPQWTRSPERYQDRVWWFGLPDGSGLRAYVLQRTPACFQARGVMFDITNLDSV
ncbi:MAG: hypothetical protein ACYC3K_13485 [Candidatus Nanopelagicales bacterium]